MARKQGGFRPEAATWLVETLVEELEHEDMSIMHVEDCWSIWANLLLVPPERSGG